MTPTEDVHRGCEKYICDLFTNKLAQCSKGKELQWLLYRQLKASQGIEKLPPTKGAIHQHVLRAHHQCHIWKQTLLPNPVILDPLTLGWKKGTDGFEAVLSVDTPAPDNPFKLIRCDCKSSNCRTWSAVKEIIWFVQNYATVKQIGITVIIQNHQ